jgi:hypothetical protein
MTMVLLRVSLTIVSLKVDSKDGGNTDSDGFLIQQ